MIFRIILKTLIIPSHLVGVFKQDSIESLRIFKHRFKVNTHIVKVWEFYTHIEHLSIITPKEVNLKVLNSTDKKFTQGTQFWIQGRILLYTSKWHSIIKSITPYEYVDEMLSGPFKRWGIYIGFTTMLN